MQRKILQLIAIAAVLTLLAGCGKSTEVSGTTVLEMKKNGGVVHTIVEDFSESYYDLEELKTSVQSQIDEYNAGAGGDNITLDSAELTDGTLRMVMTFKRAEDYTGFYRQALFCGTVKEAFEAGYDLDIELDSVKDEGTVIGKSEILDMGERHIVVVREAVTVKPFGDILYLSRDASLSESGKEAVITDSENLSYIIFK